MDKALKRLYAALERSRARPVVFESMEYIEVGCLSPGSVVSDLKVVVATQTGPTIFTVDKFFDLK